MKDVEKVTLSLPRQLMAQVRELSPTRGQSEFVASAIDYYLTVHRRRALKERLVAGYKAYAAEDTALAEEWRAADDEAWLDAVDEYTPAEEYDEPADPPR